MWGINVHVVPPVVEDRRDSHGQSGASGDRRAVLMVQPCGVLPHEGQEGLCLDGVKSAGNGLECCRDSGAAIRVIGHSGFD